MVSEDPDAPAAADEPTELDTNPAAVIAGRYVLDLAHPLGTGGMSLVYKGRDRRTRRTIAAKTLRPEYQSDAATRARFRREARMLTFLKHPNIVTVEAFVEERDIFWVILEYLDGPSVERIIAERAPLTPEAILPFLEPAAKALARIHANGFVHLDVQPRNLLTTRDGVLKLIDLGLLQPEGAPRDSRGGRTFANASYLAPEQASGEPVEPASDIYALGCVVYEMLTGAPPFVDKSGKQSLHELITARLRDEPLPVSEARPDLDIPPWVDSVVGWTLTRDPADRYHDVLTFADMFRSGVEDDLPPDVSPAATAPEVSHRPVNRIDRQWIVPPPKSTGLKTNTPPMSRESLPSIRTDQESRIRFAPEPNDDEILFAPPDPGRRLQPDLIGRWLWWACAALLALNLLVAAALLVTRGSVPPFGSAPRSLTAGEVVRVVGSGLQARAQPSISAPSLGELPAGSQLLLGGPPVAENGRVWWPVTFSLNGQDVTGYVESSWVQP